MLLLEGEDIRRPFNIRVESLLMRFPSREGLGPQKEVNMCVANLIHVFTNKILEIPSTAIEILR